MISIKEEFSKIVKEYLYREDKSSKKEVRVGVSKKKKSTGKLPLVVFGISDKTKHTWVVALWAFVTLTQLTLINDIL